MRAGPSNALGNTVININIDNGGGKCVGGYPRNALNQTTKIKRTDSISSDFSNAAAREMINSMV